MVLAKAGAIVLIQTEIGAESTVMEKLYDIPEVKEVYIVYGIYDVIAKVEAESLERIREVITSRIRKLPEIRTTSTMVIVEEKIKKE